MSDHNEMSAWRTAGAASLLALGMACGLACGLAGCGSSGGGITLDGDMADWPSNAAASADSEYLYFRFFVEGGAHALQSAPSTLVVAIDADASTASGRVGKGDPFDKLGVDLEIEFSPRDASKPGGVGAGAAVFAVAADGTRTKVPAADAGLQVSPTVASEWYEGRIARSVLADLPGLDAKSCSNTVIAYTLDSGGKIDGYADPATVTVPAPAMIAGADALAPGKPARAFRVVSFNVEKSSPIKKPEAFTRLLQQLNPDVVLVQEWEEGSAEDLAGWFTAHVGSGETWGAVKAPGTLAEGGGVGIVSRHPLQPFADSQISLPGEGGKPHNVRAVSATVTAPWGAMHLTSVHLKCCGGADGKEESTRRDEARAINAALATALASDAAPRLVGGDCNLVGTRVPLDLLATGLAPGGGDLSVATPMVVGDRAYATWRDPGTPFPPGRLDYVLYGGVRVAQSFVLDVSKLSDASLARLGVSRDDAGASDHLPVVVDLVAN